MAKTHPDDDPLSEATTSGALSESAFLSSMDALRDDEPIRIDGPVDDVSLRSLFLKVRFNDEQLSTATGFVVMYGERPYLITANHVLSGRHSETQECMDPKLSIPNNIRIAHQVNAGSGGIGWGVYQQALWDDKGPRWLVHPRGPQIDIAALELLDVPDEVILNPIGEELWNADLHLYPAMLVHVVGFLFSIRPGGVFLPIWKSGRIATEPSLDYERNKPGFFVDATTNGGMSGSPVFARAIGGFLSDRGNWVVTENAMTKFLGLYSHHLKNRDIGVVWRPAAILDVLKNGTRYIHS